MTSRALAWRTVAAKPGRAVLAVTGVTVIGALLFNMLLLSNGLLLSFRELLDTAGYDVRVAEGEGVMTARGPVPNPEALVEELRTLPEVAEADFVRTRIGATSAPGRLSVRLTIIEASPGADRRLWRIVAGRNLADAPEGPAPPVVINRALADELNLTTGSTMDLRVTLSSAPSALPNRTFRIAGIGEFDIEPDAFIAVTAMAAFGDEPAVASSDEASLVLVVSRPTYGPAAAVAAIGRLRPDLRAYSNEQVVDRFNENGFSYFRQISLVLTTITLGFAFLLVATLLSVSVNQRLHEVAALRALGLPRRRIAATLLWESVWLVGAGGLLSLPVGGVLAMAFDRILRGMPGLPERLHFFVFETRALGLHLALLAVTAVGAAAYPVWVATRLPIAATLRQETL